MRRLKRLLRCVKSKMLFATIALMTLLSTTACTQVVSEYDSLVAPDVVEYTLEQQKQALNELQTNDVPMLHEFMKDYKVMRDQSRAAKK